MHLRYTSFMLLVLGIISLVVFAYQSSDKAGQLSRLIAYRQMFAVKLGTTTDDSIFVTAIPAVHLSTQERKFQNHDRTLRTFLMRDSDQVTRIAIERSKPNEYYQLSGNYVVSPETALLGWKGSAHLVFNGINNTGTPTHFELDLNDLTMKEISLDRLTVQPPAPVADPD